MNFLMPLFIATTAVQAVGLVKQYDIAKAQAKLQNTQIELEKQMNKLQTELKKREARAAARKKQAQFIVQSIAKGTQQSSVFSGGLTSLDTYLNTTLRSIDEMFVNRQGQLEAQKDLIDLKTPSELDLVLGLAGTVGKGVAGYYTTSTMLNTPKPTSVFETNSSATNTYNLNLNWR